MTVNQIDWLSAKFQNNTNDIWKVMSLQYKKYLINKLEIELRDLNMETRFQRSNSLNQFDWSDPTKWPFGDTRTYEYNNDCLPHGNYISLFNSTDDSDKDVGLESVEEHRCRFIRNKKQKVIYRFYPRCTKSRDNTEANNAQTLGQQIGDMSPKRINYFRHCMGWGPVPIVPAASEKMSAFEVSYRKLCNTMLYDLQW